MSYVFSLNIDQTPDNSEYLSYVFIRFYLRYIEKDQLI